MKKVLLALAAIASLLCGATPVYAQQLITPVVAPQANNILPVVNSTADAAGNTALIQNALTAGGTVRVSCPVGGVAYINAVLTISSNTDFSVEQSCTLRLTAGAANAFLWNAASQTAWTTTWLGSGSGASSPFSIIWSLSSPAWVTSTVKLASTATVPTYVTSNGNIYYMTSGGCTTGATAPSGTGTGISDGACTWNYVTANQFNTPTTTTYVNAAVYWPSHGLAVGDAVWLTPKGNASYTLPAYFWGGTAAAGTQDGPTDPAYLGIFSVLAVNDANWVTVQLRQQPAQGFTGIPMFVKKADVNITCCGPGVLDYNQPSNTGGANAKTTMLVTMAGVNGLKINAINGRNVYKYVLDLNGVANADIGNVNSNFAGTASDRIKVYGPAFDVSIHDSTGPAGDDVVSAQAEDYPTQWPNSPNYLYAAGNIVNLTLKNITSVGGLAVKLYATHSLLTMDQIVLENINSTEQITDSTSYYPVILLYGTGITSKVGQITIRGGSAHMANSPFLGFYNSLVGGSAGPTFDSIILDGVGSTYDQSTTLNATAYGELVHFGSSYFTVKNLVVQNSRAVVGPNATNTGAVSLFTSTNTIKHLTFQNNYVTGLTANSGYGIYLDNGAPTVGLISVIGNTFDSVGYAARLFGPTNIDFSSNYIVGTSSNSGLGVGVAGIIASFRGNTFSGVTLGAVRSSGSYAGTIRSDGTNNFLASSIWASTSGTIPTLFNTLEIAASGTPTVNSCGAGSALGSGSNNVNGTVAVPAATTSCVYNFSANAFPIAPRNCQASDQTTGVGVSCLVSWTNATTGTITLAGASLGGTTANYTVNP